MELYKIGVIILNSVDHKVILGAADTLCRETQGHMKIQYVFKFISSDRSISNNDSFMDNQNKQYYLLNNTIGIYKFLIRIM